ncbi:hypothetical protein [Peterkaempfera sp. SMS 1(5)a]|uniref:hypothetical protein n=1 Tax=Peterkaempfera podocarpi TaxID=3232308 RepID=UPI00366D9685
MAAGNGPVEPRTTAAAPAAQAAGQPVAEPATEVLAPGQSRLLEAVLPACAHHHLALAGTPALRAYGLPVPVRRTEELELVTGDSTPVTAIADAVAATGRDAGCEAAPQTPGTPLLASLLLTPPYEPLARPVAVAIGKRPLAHPPVWTDAVLDRPVPLVSREDAASLTVTAMTDRTLPEDLLAVHALSDWFSEGELLAMAGAFDEDFRAGALAERLDKLASLDDEAYQRCGAPDERIGEVKRWALAWAQDITLDLMEGRENPDSYYDSEDDGAADDAAEPGQEADEV